ncbi:MAG: ScyD/ScyE family protein [Bryobacteraceae bacterium]
MAKKIELALLALATASALCGQSERVVATGLLQPQKLTLTPGGNLLVTESGAELHSGRVSLVTRSGSRRSLIEGLPSVTSAEGEASGPTGIAMRGRTLYVAIGGGDAEAAGPRPGTALFNDKGTSSPLFSSVLVFETEADVDNITGSFRLDAARIAALALGDTVELDEGSGIKARVSVLVNFADGVPDANRIYRFANPWGIALSADGATLWVADASRDLVWQVDTRTGRARLAAALAPGRNPTPVGPPVIDSVPTAVRQCGDELLVSQLTGFPFLRGAASIHSIQPDRTVRPYIANLSTVTDLACSGSGDCS